MVYDYKNIVREINEGLIPIVFKIMIEVIMSEIRNLTRNGETFYPLTHVDAIVSNTGSGIDDYPTPGSDNPVKSGGVSYILANIDIKNTANYNNHAYYSNDGSIDVDTRYRCTKIDVSLYSKLYVRSRSNTGTSACVLTNASGTVLAYWNFDGSKIETIDLTLYTDAKWFLYTNFAPYLPEADMIIQSYLKDGISLFIAEHENILKDIDNTPTQNSQKFVNSGGVKSYVDSKVSNIEKYHNFGVDIHDFTHFVSIGSSWTITSDNKSATSNGNGYANRLSFNKDSFEDASILSAKITPSSSTFNVLIGKTFADIDGVSTLLGVLKDSNHTYLTVNTIINSSEVLMKHKFDISSLNIGYGLTFYVKLEKLVQNTMLYNVSITDDIGNCFEVNGLGNGDTLSDDLLSLGNGEIDGANWGRITLFCESGGAVFSDISFGYPLLMSDLALTIVGHSMVEANTMNDEKNKRFAALLRDSIGADRVCINGQGGMQTASEGLSGWIDNLLEYVKSSKFMLFCLGRNEPDDNNTCVRYQRINDKVIAKGIRPIWLTVAPARDGDGSPFTLVNTYIKQHFDYIETDKVFYNADGTIDTSKFVDTVHPNAKGYQAMYNVIKNDKTCLWTV